MVDTPMMQQWREMKAKQPDTILLYRCGDFYETFYGDAEIASRVLGLTLTSRNNGGAAEVPLAGVPVRALPEYLRRLVAKGYRVSVCEQIEDPRLAKGVVKREIVETITPGAVFADDLLDGARNNFLCAAAIAPDGRTVGVAAADVSTGELRLATVAISDADALLARLAPREILLPRGVASVPLSFGTVLVTEREGWEFDPSLAGDDLARQYAIQSVDGLGVVQADAQAVGAAGALLRYLRELQPGGVPHLARPIVERPGGTMPLDEMTRRNLELVESLRPAAGAGHAEETGTLFGVLDRTATPMGARLLRQWLLAPLVCRDAIDARLDAVATAAGHAIGRTMLRDALDGVRDVERLASKAAAGRATPRELRALGDSLGRLPAVREALARLTSAARSAQRSAGRLDDLARHWDDCGELCAAITRLLVRPPAAAARRRGDDRGGGRRRARRAARAARRRQGRDRRDPGDRARADGDRVAQGRLQPRVRLLHRDLERAPRAGARRLSAAADAHERRALRHAGAQGVRGARAHGRGADRDARARAVRGAARRGRARDRAAAARSPDVSRSSTCSPRSPRSPSGRATCARR